MAKISMVRRDILRQNGEVLKKLFKIISILYNNKRLETITTNL